jgi:undecaprenyl diphosphate synthase
MKEEGLPRHIAIVMDGNGRWAQSRSLPRLAGHDAGMKALKGIVKACGRRGIEYLTVYAFSTENWKRPEQEVKGIFNLLIVYIDKELDELHRENVKVGVLGEYKELPAKAVASLHKSLRTTKDNTGLRFNIALNYGSRAEILRAVRSIGEQTASGGLSASDITEEMLAKNLYTKDIPDPDLVIRTSGEQRLSNFLLWQTAYSEFYFTDTLWPDFTEDHLMEACAAFQNRKRRFGDIQ